MLDLAEQNKEKECRKAKELAEGPLSLPDSLEK